MHSPHPQTPVESRGATPGDRQATAAIPPPPPSVESPRFRVVVMAGSVGGYEAVRTILLALPRDLPVPVAIVLHRTGERNSLARSLNKFLGIPARKALAGDRLEPGIIYIAPPHLHMRVNPDRTISLHDGTRIRHVRSSANPLFESASQVFGPEVIAVVLSGYGRDATDGVQSVKSRGGTVIAQNEPTSKQFSMPRSAIETGAVDLVLPLDEIAPALTALVRTGKFGTPEQTSNGTKPV